MLLGFYLLSADQYVINITQQMKIKGLVHELYIVQPILNMKHLRNNRKQCGDADREG